MPEPRITNQRRRFVEALSRQPKTTFATLKQELVGKGPEKMDLATLYRIVETFRSQGLVHEIEVAGERVIFPCHAEHTTDHDAITLSFCENCGEIYDEHTPLPPNQSKSETYIRLKSCPACVIQ